MNGRVISICLLLLSPVAFGAKALPAPATQPALPAPTKALAAWQAAQYRFTPEVETAYLQEARAVALHKIAAEGKVLPADFLAWVDSDPVVKTTVFGARQDPAGALLMLRSLELDLGQQAVRQKYTQLALAMAIVHGKDASKVDVGPRPPLALRIGGDPRKLVDTKAKDRPLDLDDHIINFLNDHAPIMEDVVVGQKEVLPELKYDASGKAIPQPNAKPKKVPVTERRPRPLRAADVIAEAALEKEFNEYLKAHGQTVQINCGVDKRLNWRSTDLTGIDTKGVKMAYELFVHAYQAKGYLPAERDATPTPAERCAFLIRNHETVLPAEKKIAWPKFPLSAPWPTMTLLAADAQPLRERQDIWARYSDHGEFHGYGEYVGNIAQTPLYLQARRLTPYAFNYNSVQMMLKDGGVCGVMANIATRSYLSLGVPASTAGQPGHCALIRFGYNPKNDTYGCGGEQYATAGDGGTNPHVPWYFGDVDHPAPMVYHQSVAWSVNYDLQRYLDSMVAHTFYKRLPEADRKAHGQELLRSAAALNPYNFLLANDAIGNAAEPADAVAYWTTLKPLLANGKPGCPADGLYNATIKNSLFAKLAALPTPADATAAGKILAFLQDEKCNNEQALTAYKVAAQGLSALLAETQSAYTAYLSSPRTDAASTAMAERLSAVTGRIPGKPERAKWVADRWDELQGKELYLGAKNAVTADKCVAVLGKLAAKKPRPDKEQIQSLLDQITERLKTQVAAPTRTPKDCAALASIITTTGVKVTDAEQKLRWAEALSQVIVGKEQIQVQVKGKPQTQRDPCVDAIAGLRVAPLPI